jgi:O-antigen/teichoic acid export membrane protein
VWSLVIGTYASIVFSVIASWAFAGFVPHPRRAEVRMWRELARFGRPVVAGSMIRRVVAELPVLALGPVKGAAVLGQFTYAYRAASQPLGAVVNVGGYVLLPAFSRLSSHDERFRAAVLTSLRWLCILSFPAGMLMIPLGRPAVILGFGAQWRDAGDAAMVLGVYCVALSLDSIASEAWKAVARTDMLPRMHGLSLVLTALLVGALVEPFGLIGVTVGMSVAAVGVAVYATRGMSRVLDIPLGDLLREIWPPALASTLMAASLYCLQHWVVRAEQHGIALGIALVALEALLGTALYALVMARVAPGPTRQVLDAARALPARLRARRGAAGAAGAA